LGTGSRRVDVLAQNKGPVSPGPPATVMSTKWCSK